MNNNTDHSTPPGRTKEKPLSITQLNWLVKSILEETVPRVWVQGEVSDLSRPSSGHLYFSLKDKQCQVRAVMWRSSAERLPFSLEDGQSVICAGAVELYAPRGSYQLIIDQVQPQGVGPLQLAFKQLHQKLSAQGLFDVTRKKSLPRFPKRIGFVTSPSGAALHDFLESARQLWSDMELLIIPARVQGDQAASEIARGIRLAHQVQPDLDLLIVGRGGGSMEDLWCFNEEKVVRTIAKARIPIVSAVGHEIDVTLSDLVADARALTPTHAAQLILPNRQQLGSRVAQIEQRLPSLLHNRLRHVRERLHSLTSRGFLARPHELHLELRQQVDEYDTRAQEGIRRTIQRQQERLISLARNAEALSPLRVLVRGYSLTQNADSQTIRSIRDVEENQIVTTVLPDGQFTSIVSGQPKHKDERSGRA